MSMSNTTSFTCKICGKDVSKRQSYAYEGGRACKTHQESQDGNQARIDAKKAEDDRKKAEEEAKRERREKRHDWKYTATIMDSGCWKCMKPGVTLRQYYLNLLIGLEREKLKGEFNIFTNPKRTAELAGMDEQTLIVMPYPMTRSCRLPLDTYMWTQMSGNQVQLCQHCATAAGYDPQKREKELNSRNDLTIDQLIAVHAVYENSEHHQVVKKIAELAETLEAQTHGGEGE
jgi:hypothetical protein